MKKHSFAILVLSLLIFLWVAMVILSGIGWNPFGQRWNFSNSGAFGDSFGPLGAVMAALAAFAALETLNEQRTEFRRLAIREQAEDQRREIAELDIEKRRRIQDAIQSRQIFESTFFELLKELGRITSEIDVGSGDSKATSRDAFKKIAGLVVSKYKSTGDLKTSWTQTLVYHKNDLNHYFRFLYHVVCYVDSQDISNKYFYIRLLRARLSEAELVLIFINCTVGEGNDKFKPLVEKYALLHNVSQESKSGWDMEKFFDPGAFDHNDF